MTFTVPLSTQEYKWVPANCWGNLTNCWEVTCDGLASRPGGIEILLAASCYGNRDKLRQHKSVLASRLHFLRHFRTFGFTWPDYSTGIFWKCKPEFLVEWKAPQVKQVVRSICLPLTADIVLKALRTLKVRIPDKFSTPGSIVI